MKMKKPRGVLLYEDNRRTRDLERLAAQGDEDAAHRLAAHRLRMGKLPFLDFMRSWEAHGRQGWDPIGFGSSDLVISIQAGDMNYSEPRVNGLLATEYSRWEVAIFDSKHIIEILGDARFDAMPHRRRCALL